MAEALFNNRVKDSGKFCASSCGLFADGSPISHNAKLVLEEVGIDVSHLSRKIDKGILENADYIFGITENHANSIISLFPEYADKVYAFPTNIADPYGCPVDVYRFCRDEIQKAVDLLIRFLEGENNA